MFETAVSLHEFGELGIHTEPDPTTGVRAAPEQFGKYGLGLSLVQQLPLIFASSTEELFGGGRSNILFPLTNMCLTALTALFVALCLRSLGLRFSTSALGAVGFAFGTFAWPYVSYDFSEPLQATCLTAALWLVMRGVRDPERRRSSLVLAGCALGFAVLTKVALLVLVPGYLFYLWPGLDPPLRRRLSQLAWCAVPVAVFLAGIAALNVHRFGSITEFGYREEVRQFTTPLWSGLYGLVVGPNKGLVFYAPLALLLPWSLARLGRQHRREGMLLAFVTCALIFFTAKWWSWEGGSGWGPRLILPIVPAIAIATAMSLESSRICRMLFVVLLIAGAGVNLLGVLVNFGVWNSVTGLHLDRIPLEVEGRPAAEYVEQGGKRWFSPYVAVNYVPSLSPIVGHAWLLRLRHGGIPFPLRELADGKPETPGSISFPPLKLDFSLVETGKSDYLVWKLQSAHLFLWEALSGEPRDPRFIYPMYGAALEEQGDRAVAKGDIKRSLYCYGRAMNLAPDLLGPVLKLARVQLQIGQVASARDNLVRYVERHERDWEARLVLALVHEWQGEKGAAAAEYRTVLRLRPDPKHRMIAEDRLSKLSAW